jgi:hypothetical protein
MARIPNDEIEQLKQDISVQRLAEARGVELKPALKHDPPRGWPIRADRSR